MDADFVDLRQTLSLYRDGERVQTQRSPATFEIGPETAIKASMGLLGMREIDLLVRGETSALTPVDGTLEAWRLNLEREHPGPSHAIGAISWAVLVIAFVTGLAELIALTGIDPPVATAGPINAILGLAAVAAALERALRFKSNRWLD